MHASSNCKKVNIEHDNCIYIPENDTGGRVLEGFNVCVERTPEMFFEIENSVQTEKEEIVCMTGIIIMLQAEY